MFLCNAYIIIIRRSIEVEINSYERKTCCNIYAFLYIQAYIKKFNNNETTID